MVINQYGCEGMLSELYGVTNWDFDFRGHKLAGDWQAALGVTACPSSYLDIHGRGRQKRLSSIDWLSSPWYEEYSNIENYFARLNTALTRGETCCSCWCYSSHRIPTGCTGGQGSRPRESTRRWMKTLKSLHSGCCLDLLILILYAKPSGKVRCRMNVWKLVNPLWWKK